MTKGELLAKYRDLSPEDQRQFDRWLKANAVVATIFASGGEHLPVTSDQRGSPDHTQRIFTLLQPSSHMHRKSLCDALLGDRDNCPDAGFASARRCR